MTDKMYPIPFRRLFSWMFNEYQKHQSIFAIPAQQFCFPEHDSKIKLFGDFIDTPLGPAAGPHTQMAQNIVSAYLTGGRFFELKTVQKLDRLEIEKPCIDVQDEGYNVEWSQELTLEQSYAEYLKAWFLLHLLKEILGPSDQIRPGFIFNLSVGYDLAGIKSEKMDRFISQMKDARESALFQKYQNQLKELISGGELGASLTRDFTMPSTKIENLIQKIEHISPHISGSVTLSTMHGCPPQKIEAICHHLIVEKRLHTYVKLNPTLLGFEGVRSILTELGYRYIQLHRTGFEHDLQYADAVPMLRRLKRLAEEHGKEFGVKLSNTLGVVNHLGKLPGEDMYLSGRALFPLTIKLANQLAWEFEGDLNISYSGGASAHNIRDILETGIYPVTMVTDLLKPGGYFRLTNMVEKTMDLNVHAHLKSPKINLTQLKRLADRAMSDSYCRKETREVDSIKVPAELPTFDCYLAPCVEACPIQQDVADYIRLVEQQRFAEAYQVIISKNPLPHITGYICDHQCQHHCTRWDYDHPVQIREMKKVAAENGYRDYLKKWKQEFSVKGNDVKAAVVGAGPAGLSAAYFLVKAGFHVTVFEREQTAGGVVQHIIPEFRLPQSAIDNDVDFIRKHGVKFRFGFKEPLSVEQLKAENHKYIFLGIGASQSRLSSFKTDGENVFNALDFLCLFRRGERLQPGNRVAVVGGGNSAMDSARAALRCRGVKQVYLIYRRTREFMPADKEEFEAALSEGAQLKELLLPVKFDGTRLLCQKMQLGETDTDGRRKVTPIEGQFEQITADGIISAIGEKVDIHLLQRNNVSLDEAGKVVIRGESNETNLDNVYIGGDALRGPSTVVESIADGKKAAHAMIRKEGLETPVPDFSGWFNSRQRITDIIGRKGMIFPAKPDEFRNEADRCLECSLLCNKCVDVCPNRANVAVATNGENGFRNPYQILHLDGLCNECGNCETFCPYAGSPYREKPTFFWNEDDFRNSTNNGFFLQSPNRNSNPNFLIRFGSETGTMKFDDTGNVVHSTWPENSMGHEFNRFAQFAFLIFKNYPFLLSSVDLNTPENTRNGE